MGPPSVRSPWPLRWHLVALIGFVLAPVVAFSGYVLLQLAGRTRDVAERRMLRTVRAMSAEVDGQIGATLRVLETIAESNPLDADDLAGFTREAQRVLRGRPRWEAVILSAPDRRVLVNVAAPSGAPAEGDPASLERVLAERVPVVGSLASDPEQRRFGVPVRFPVLADGQLRYVLTAVLAPSALETAASPPEDPDLQEVSRSVIDADGRLLYRNRNIGAAIGHPVSQAFAEQLRLHSEGIFPSTSLEGTPSYVAFSRGRSGLIATVVVPRELLDGPRRRSLAALELSGLLALLLSICGAGLLSRRFARGMDAVASAAEALARGDAPEVPTMPIAELDELGRALTGSARLLRERAAERDRHLADAEAAVRARDEFLSLASHELRTPLTSLQLNGTLLEREAERAGSPDRERVRRFAAQAQRQVSRLARLVDDMLDISRISAGRLSLEPEPMDLAATVADVLQRMTPHLEQAGCTLSLEAPAAAEGSWDRHRIEQVLTNLLTNAARYAPGAPVRVSVRLLDERAEIAVQDGGPGIPVEERERVFRKFERAQGPQPTGGLGLGLFIVREIATMHGGTVRIEGGPGEGARFVVSLPRSPAEAPPVQRAAVS